MKTRWPVIASELRHKLVFTREEKRVIIFVVAALALGGATKGYRERHPELARHVDPKHPWRKPVALLASPAPTSEHARTPRRHRPPAAQSAIAADEGER